jgi:hypothetical protein
MLPEAKSKDLLYLSDGRTDVYVYSLPDLKLVGTLTGFVGAYGECVDNRGDVFVASADQDSIVEYAHGGSSPITTLRDPYVPFSCAIDPTTGNLAVFGNDYGTVAIYLGAQGTPTYYVTATSSGYCGYDNKGNLFVDGYTEGGAVFGEIPNGSGSFERLTLSRGSLTSAGAIRWAGSYLALGIGGSHRATIYHVSVSGSTATVIGSTSLRGPGSNFNIVDGTEYWIQGSMVIAAFNRHREGDSGLGFWRYPGGGNVVRTLRGPYGKEEVVGVAVSPRSN